MTFKRFILFPLTILLALIITLLEIQILYSGEYHRTIISIQMAVVMSYVTFGWFWFLPLLAFVRDSLYHQWWRWIIWISPLLLTILFYVYLNLNSKEEMDYLLYAGYYYRYPYYLDIMLSIAFSVVVMAVIVELWRTKKQNQGSEL